MSQGRKKTPRTLGAFRGALYRISGGLSSDKRILMPIEAQGDWVITRLIKGMSAC